MGAEVVYFSEDVLVEREVATSWLVASEGPYVAALDPALTPVLAAEGLSREVVHHIQRLRREAGFAMADRIALGIEGDAAVLAAVDHAPEFIAAETLARDLALGEAVAGAEAKQAVDIDGSSVTLTARRPIPAPERPVPPPDRDEGMNKKNLTHFEKRLMEERARVMKELGHYDESFNATLQGADGDLSSYSFHMADQGTDAMEREKQFLFASQEGRYLWHVNEALRRLYKTPGQVRPLPYLRQGDQLRAAGCAAARPALHQCKEKEEDAKRR